MKTITAFVVTEAHGFFVDREDIELAAGVSPRSGDVVLNEPFAEEEEVHSGCIPGKAVEGFELRDVSGGALLVVRYRRGDRVLEHRIGWVTPDTPATEWLERVNALYATALAVPSP